MKSLIRRFSTSRSSFPYIFILFIVLALIYAQGLKYPFVTWDDNLHFYDNFYGQNFQWSDFGRIWLKPVFYLYIPITYTVWAFIIKMTQTYFPSLASYQDIAILFKATNLLFHFLNSVLIFFLIKRILKLMMVKVENWAALLGTLVFALHPLQVESVAWASGFKDLLCTFFVLLSCFQYLKSLSLRMQGVKSLSLYLAFFFYLLACLSKPTAVILPLLILFLDRVLSWDAQDGWRLLSSWKKWGEEAVLPMIPWFLAAIPIFIITKVTQPPSILSYIPPLFIRPFVVADSLAFYLGKILAPFPLLIDYCRTPQLIIKKNWIIWTWIFPTLVGLFAWKWHKKQPSVWIGIVLALIWIIPVSGIIPFGFQTRSTVADRYFYFSFFGIALALAGILAKTSKRWPWVLTSLVLIYFASLSFLQVQNWQDSLTLYRFNIRHNSQSAVTHLNYAVEMMKKNKMDEAFAHNKLTVTIDPNYGKGQKNLGMFYFIRGEYAKAEKSFRKYIKIDSRLPADYQDEMAYVLLGNSIVEQGKLEEALLQYQRAITSVSNNKKGEVYSQLGKAYGRSGHYNESIAYLTLSLVYDRNNAETYHNLGTTYSLTGEQEKALDFFRKSLEIRPNFPEAYYNIGNIYYRWEKFNQAIGYYQQALSLSPKMVQAKNNLKLAKDQVKKN